MKRVLAERGTYMANLKESLLKEQNRLEKILRKAEKQLKDLLRGQCVCPVVRTRFNIITVCRGNRKMAGIFRKQKSN